MSRRSVSGSRGPRSAPTSHPHRVTQEERTKEQVDLGRINRRYRLYTWVLVSLLLLLFLLSLLLRLPR